MSCGDVTRAGQSRADDEAQGEDFAGVGLADAIGLIRSELQRAKEASSGSDLAFRTGAIELEFEVAFNRSAQAEGGVRVMVLSLGAKGELARSRTQRLKVTLEPVESRTGRSAEISDKGMR